MTKFIKSTAAKSPISNAISKRLDPDYGLELRANVEETLRKSLKSKKRTPVEKVVAELGFKW